MDRGEKRILSCLHSNWIEKNFRPILSPDLLKEVLVEVLRELAEENSRWKCIRPLLFFGCPQNVLHYRIYKIIGVMPHLHHTGGLDLATESLLVRGRGYNTIWFFIVLVCYVALVCVVWQKENKLANARKIWYIAGYQRRTCLGPTNSYPIKSCSQKW